MKSKMKSNKEIYKSIRKEIPPPSQEHKPKRGIYRRKSKFNKFDDDY